MSDADRQHRSRDLPQMITGRFEYDDAHTIERYEATEGYVALRTALEMGPEAVHNEVKAASLLGRGGAGFPAGVKWGFCPPDVWPRYLVVNGDESEPGTYKDRLLMERDPHQLIEGVLIAAYAVGCAQAFLYVRGEMAHAQERIAAGAQRGLRPRASSARTSLGTDFSCDVILHWGAGAYIVGEETALIESLEGNRGMPRLKPPYFPAAKGLYMQPTIVNNVETLANLPVDHPQRRRRLHRLRRRELPGHADVRGVGPREEARRLRGRVRHHHLPRPDLRRLRRHPRLQHAEGVHPRRRVGARGSTRSTSTCRSRPAPSARPARCSAPVPSSSWTTPPTRSRRPGGSSASSPASPAASARRAARARRGSRRSCAACSTATAAPRTWPCCSTCATTSVRPSPGRRSRPPSARSARRRCRPSPAPSCGSTTSSRPTAAAARSRRRVHHQRQGLSPARRQPVGVEAAGV